MGIIFLELNVYLHVYFSDDDTQNRDTSGTTWAGTERDYTYEEVSPGQYICDMNK